jgi:serine/threonine protein kinase
VGGVRTPISDPLRVGPYRIVGRLGSGGMGWVYLGRSASGRALALKVVRPELASDQQFRDRFAREVEAARAVSGAFTAAVVDADTGGDPPWLATLYVAGPSLAEAVRGDGPLSESAARRLGAGLAEALQAIHAAGVVHRDLKPANVLLAEDGPRVIDFGISRFGGSNSITTVGTVLGTPPFMSPEQFRGELAGPPSDVFALGAVLAFAVTGNSPFGSGSGVMYRILHEQPDLDSVPDGLRPLVERCLAKAPGDRPTPAGLLDELLRGRAVQEWPPPTVAETIQVRKDDLAARNHSRGTVTSVPSCLLLHAQALLDAGLTDRMVAEAVARG